MADNEDHPVTLSGITCAEGDFILVTTNIIDHSSRYIEDKLKYKNTSHKVN